MDLLRPVVQLWLECLVPRRHCLVRHLLLYGCSCNRRRGGQLLLIWQVRSLMRIKVRFGRMIAMFIHISAVAVQEQAAVNRCCHLLNVDSLFSTPDKKSDYTADQEYCRNSTAYNRYKQGPIG